MTAQADADSVWARRMAGGPQFAVDPRSFPGQALEQFWRREFSAAPAGARMLEIGCGSGDVSLWAAEAARGLKIVASDVLDDPDLVRRHPDISFLGSAPVEALPVADDAFDLVVSNFAIEYARREPALAEVARVLAPGGRLILVLHAADSVLTATSRTALALSQALAAAEIPDKVRRAAALRADHLSRRKMLKEVVKRRADFPRADVPNGGLEYFDLAERLLKGDPKARQEVAELDRLVGDRREMSRQQSGVSLTLADLAALDRRLQACGLRVETHELTYRSPEMVTEKVGWLALATRPA